MYVFAVDNKVPTSYISDTWLLIIIKTYFKFFHFVNTLINHFFMNISILCDFAVCV